MNLLSNLPSFRKVGDDFNHRSDRPVAIVRLWIGSKTIFHQLVSVDKQFSAVWMQRHQDHK